MIYDNTRWLYMKWPDNFYAPLKGNIELQRQKELYGFSADIVEDEVVESKSRKTKLNSVIGTGEPSPTETRKRRDRIVTYDISQYMSRGIKVESTQEKFYRLCERWKRETKHVSCPEDMILHPAYLRIIGLGPSAIPLILAELERELDFWFWALDAISDENPVSDDVQGDMEEMRLAWIQWGHKNAYRFRRGILGRVV